jgi:hypothetical protein
VPQNRHTDGMSAPDATIRLRLETSTPGDPTFTAHVSPPEAGKDLVQELERAGFYTGELIELSVPQVIEAALHAGPALGVVGGPALAAALKFWADRNKGKKIEVDFNNQRLLIEGMSVKEVGRTIDELTSAQDALWRKQMPGRWPETAPTGNDADTGTDTPADGDQPA